MKPHLFTNGQEKSGRFRTLLVFKQQDKAFFMCGFAKSQPSNIKKDKLKALKKYAKGLLGYSDQTLTVARQSDALYEVTCDE